jgi:hypothetical protein
VEQDRAATVLLHHQELGGRPLTTYEVIVNLIASTTTKTGLTVRAALDPRPYETGIAISDEELEHLNLARAKFDGDWNYSIKPRR